MKPVVTTDEMRAIDASSSVPTDVLISRAAAAVYFASKKMLGGTYGRHVVVVAGQGNNGADGRSAAALLQRAGARVSTVASGSATQLVKCDLVIDAAYGNGFHGQYVAPLAGDARVLAVDIPSGLDGNTGGANEGSVTAGKTVVFTALRPGHLLNDGPGCCGDIEVVDIGLDVSNASLQLTERSDVISRLPRREHESHKWRTAVAVVAGSPGMLGAARLCSEGAARSGAGMVQLLVPGVDSRDLSSIETVTHGLSGTDWQDDALRLSSRAKVIVIGPGLGRDQATQKAIRELIARAPVPVVLDADALVAVAGYDELLRDRNEETVLTPHDGEFKTLTGSSPRLRRWESAQELAEATNSVVVLKGSTAVIAKSGSRVLLNNTGDSRLATAGTGDVLAGAIGAFIAEGLDSYWASAVATYVHGAASKLGHRRGYMAGDLPAHIATWIDKHSGVLDG